MGLSISDSNRYKKGQCEDKSHEFSGILEEATDAYDVEAAKANIKDGKDYKDFLFNTTHGMWSKAISWEILSQELQPELIIQRSHNFKTGL